ncbi:MAG: CZB domain-containing protein [Deferribacteraceae bacterium]|nr:CZB domain-containing protein [Deferribacteraceae bacterium]
MFINKLYEYTSQRGHMEYNPVDHHNCRLGKWYESGVGHKEYRELPSYTKLLLPHEKVHATAGRIKQTNIEEQANEVANMLHDVNTASASVNMLLDALVKEKDAQMSEAERA